MIVYPEDWRKAGRFVTTTMIHYSLMRTIRNIPCRYLSYSGGLDSSLLLYHMLCTGRKVVTFTATCGEDHPDAQYSRIGIDYYQRLFGEDKLEAHWMVYSSTGDDLVKEHYKELAKYCDSIITGDGVDEYMAGYYCHQEVDVDKKEEVYIDRLRRLQAEHLEPLDSNSGPVKVYIPYLDDSLVSLFAQIPLRDKVDWLSRKKVMLALAKGRVPEEIIDRRKYGFGTPVLRYCRGRHPMAKGIHANERSGLRPLKAGEEVAYGGGGFHIVKKKATKKRRRSK